MVLGLFNSFLSWYFKKRIDQLTYASENPAEVQDKTFKRLLKAGSRTAFGRMFDFQSLKTPEQFAHRVPVQDYESLKPFIDRMMKGEQNVLWNTEIRWFAKSSGTTADKSKFIPVSYEALEECHFRGGRDLLTYYCNNNPDAGIFQGKGLLIGGSHQINHFNEQSFYGDLSAVMMNNLPMLGTLLSTPRLDIALMPNWEEKIEKMAQATKDVDVTSISGVPTWTLVLIRRLFELKDTDNLLDIWPNLELYMHGGVSFVPYREQFEKLIPSSKMRYMESYNASEGFFAIQDDLSRDDMLLMTDYGVYYEFIPLGDIDKEYPKVLRLEEVEIGKVYSMVITTNSGLWRYAIGDTLEFTSIKPYRIRIAGRTKSFINAFGEELMVDNAEQAIRYACEGTNAIICDYTAGPVYMTADDSKGAHEWLIEFKQQPDAPEKFMNLLDEKLKELNSDYEAKRQGSIALDRPILLMLPEGTFYDWLKTKGKLGGQHKVPRLSNHRKIINEINDILNNNDYENN